MAKRRSDSLDVTVELAKKAGNKIKPLPMTTLPDGAIPFWDVIVGERHNWTQVDLIQAANLAECLYDIEQEKAMLRHEGSVTLGGKNGMTPVMNPRHTVLEQLSRRSVVLQQKLQIHAQALVGKPENHVTKNSKHAMLGKAKNEIEDDLLGAKQWN